jgi:ANTAR domain
MTPVRRTPWDALGSVESGPWNPQTATILFWFRTLRVTASTGRCGGASYAAVAVGNMHVHETTRQRAQNLEIAMQNRAVIQQAEGILMAQRRCDAVEAFGILAAASQRSN